MPDPDTPQRVLYGNCGFDFSFDNGAFDEFNPTQPNALSGDPTSIPPHGKNMGAQTPNIDLTNTPHASPPQGHDVAETPQHAIIAGDDHTSGQASEPLSLENTIHQLIRNLSRDDNYNAIIVEEDAAIQRANNKFKEATNALHQGTTMHTFCAPDQCNLTQAIVAAPDQAENVRNIMQRDAPGVEIKVVGTVKKKCVRRIAAGLSQSNKRVLKRPSEYLSPFKHGRPRNPPDCTLSLELMKTLCADNSPHSRLFFDHQGVEMMQFGDVSYNGAAIKEFFADGGTTQTPLLMDDCVNCLSYDDRVHRPECYGYRIFIGPRISAILHPEALTTGKSVPSFNMEHLVHRLNQILPRTDPARAKLETIKSFQWLFGAFKSCMQGANKLRCILTDEDQAMAEAIKLEFPGVIHRLCRWHVTNKVQPQLNDLAAVHKGFNEKFSSAINHPLTPNEFELAWKDLLDEFGLHNDPTLRTLYRNRKDWVKAFFKKDYCGRMTSTQRSESVNMMVKNESLDRKTSLHMFPKLMLQFIQRRSEKEAAEAYGDMSIQETGAQWSFVEQAARLYTRNVFMQFNKTVSAATRYHIVPDPDQGEHHYLVQHTNRTSKITWGQHEFKITGPRK